MKLTGAAILVSRDVKVLQAAPAAYPYRSAEVEEAMSCSENSPGIKHMDKPDLRPLTDESSASNGMARRLVLFGAFAVALMVIVVDGIYLTNGFLLWTSAGPIFGWNTTYEDTAKQFDDFAKAVKSSDEHVATARKRNFEAVYAIAQKPAANEKEGMSNFAELNRRWGEAAGIDVVGVSEKESLFAEFRKELAKRNAEAIQRVAIRDSRILSFVVFLVLLLIGIGASWLFLREFRRSAERALLQIQGGGKTKL